GGRQPQGDVPGDRDDRQRLALAVVGDRAHGQDRGADDRGRLSVRTPLFPSTSSCNLLQHCNNSIVARDSGRAAAQQERIKPNAQKILKFLWIGPWIVALIFSDGTTWNPTRTDAGARAAGAGA